MTPKKDYTTEALKLSKAIDIAIDSFRKFKPTELSEDNVNHIVKVYSEWKDSLLNSEQKYKTIASLKYRIQEVFTYFQEGAGKTVDYFWGKIKDENLDYIREDKLRKILDRGKIKGRIEYEYAIDLIVAAEQEGRITKEESMKLDVMIDEFEQHKKK